jgi:thymidylate synthase (FAD)
VITKPSLFLVGEMTIDPFVIAEATGYVWNPQDDEDGAPENEKLVEFAGRACYQSWMKPNPDTAQTAGYIHNIKKQRHFSVMEFAEVAIYFTGVSRSLTHELIRHRHFSYAQLSQRYVDSSDMDFVVPPAMRGDREMEERLKHSWAEAMYQYNLAVDKLTAAGKTRKQAREAARAFLPSCAETRITVKGNFRAWRHFIALRAMDHAEAEICEVAIAVLRLLKDEYPASFEDFDIFEGQNNPYIATTPLAELV